MIRSRITTSFAIACSSVALLAGCGGDDGASTSKDDDGGSTATKATKVDACRLLDKAAVAKAIGEDVSKVEGAGTPDGTGTCSWFGVDDGSLMQKGVTIIAAADNGKERWTGHKELYAAKAEPEPGIGDEAFTDGEIIAAYEGDAFVVVSPLYNDAGVTLEQVKPLGIEVLDELQ